MHEHGLMKSVVDQVLRIADAPVTLVTLRVGDLSGCSPDHLVDHFRLAAQGTSLENVDVRIVEGSGIGVTLDSIELES